MTQFSIVGMTCGGCSAALTRALEHAGLAATVDLQTHTATVHGEADPKAVIAVIEGAGFEGETVEADPS